VFAPKATPCPDDLHDARIAEQFGCTPDELDRHRLQYEMWYALLAQAEYARQVKDDTSKVDDEWWKEFEEFIPSGMNMDAGNLEALKLLKGQ
jgi:hypothetical protein